MWELALVLALSAFVFYHFVCVVGLNCLVWKFVLCYVPQKCMEKNDLGYFEECHMVEVVVLCWIGVLFVVQGGKYVRCGSRSYHHLHFPPGSSCHLFLQLNSPIQSRCDDWAMVDCG